MSTFKSIETLKTRNSFEAGVNLVWRSFELRQEILDGAIFAREFIGYRHATR